MLYVMADAYLEYNSAEVSELITRCQAGEREAFDHLVARYQRYVFNLKFSSASTSSSANTAAMPAWRAGSTRSC
jgi:hypothetical protein